MKHVQQEPRAGHQPQPRRRRARGQHLHQRLAKHVEQGLAGLPPEPEGHQVATGRGGGGVGAGVFLRLGEFAAGARGGHVDARAEEGGQLHQRRYRLRKTVE